MRRARTLFARTTAASLVLVLAIWVPMAAEGAQHLVVKVTPRTGLLDFTGDGQFLSVSWSHVPRDSVLYLRECVRGATDAGSQCAQPGYTSTCGDACPGIETLGVSDKSGSGTAVAQVAIGLINVKPNLDPIEGRTFVCDYQNPCSIFVGTDPTHLDTMTETPISFATPPLACPTDGSPITTEGGSAGFRVIEFDWSVKVCAAPRNISLDYTLQPAQTALNDYIQGDLSGVDLAVVPGPMDASQRAALEAAGGSVAYAPVTASGLVFAYRVFDQRTGHQVSTLTLTPDLLAKIFTGRITQWYLDRQIERLNPGIQFPTFIATVGRGDANEDTLAMTSWMWANARGSWVAGGRRTSPNPFASGPTDILPSLGQIDLVTGARGEARVIARGDGDVISTSTYGWIGYVDSSWAASYELPTVRIRYPDGKTVKATPRTIAAGIDRMVPDALGLLRPDYSREDPTAWPMPTVSYAAIPHGAKRTKNPPAPEKVDALAALLTFAVGAGQTGLPDGYVPLPASLREQTRTLSQQLMNAPPTPPPSSPPPSQPSSPPSGGSAGPPPTAPPSPPEPPSSSPTPSTGTSGSPTPPPLAVYAAPAPPSGVLVAASARVILPWLVVVCFVSLAIGTVLLFRSGGGTGSGSIRARAGSVLPIRRTGKRGAAG